LDLTAETRDELIPADERPGDGLRRSYLGLFDEAKRAGADVGTNIVLEGVKQRDGDVRAPTSGEVRESVGVLRRMVAPAPQAGSTGASQATGGGAGAPLEAIAACESGGDPSAIGGGGAYRGKYQFTYSTWQSVGGTGDPAAAPEAEQDQRAATLMAQGGAGHWPVCGG
jgi:hypothetical protein